jgi:hypothetical protein
VRAHFKNLGNFVRAHAAQFPGLPVEGPKPPMPAVVAAAAAAAAAHPPTVNDPDLAFLAGRMPSSALPLGPPHGGVARAVAAAGVAGVDFAGLADALSRSLGLPCTVKKARLSAYLARFPHSFHLVLGPAGEVQRVHWRAAAAAAEGWGWAGAPAGAGAAGDWDRSPPLPAAPARPPLPSGSGEAQKLSHNSIVCAAAVVAAAAADSASAAAAPGSARPAGPGSAVRLADQGGVSTRVAPWPSGGGSAGGGGGGGDAGDAGGGCCAGLAELHEHLERWG